MAVRENDVGRVEKRDPEPGRVRDQQVRLSGVEDDLCVSVLDQKREPGLTAEIPIDTGCVLGENRAPHNTPR